MTDNGHNAIARDRLQTVLAAYGADPARWPQGDRKLAPLLAAADPGLAAPVKDARSTDLVLAQATHPIAPTGAAQRLIARAEDVPGKVVSFNRRDVAGPNARQTVLPRRLAVLTALAASLALGFYLGANGQGDWLTPPLLAEESPEYLSAELDVLDGTLQFFEDHMEP